MFQVLPCYVSLTAGILKLSIPAANFPADTHLASCPGSYDIFKSPQSQIKQQRKKLKTVIMSKHYPGVENRVIKKKVAETAPINQRRGSTSYQTTHNTQSWAEREGLIISGSKERGREEKKKDNTGTVPVCVYLPRGNVLEARTHAWTAGLWRNDFPFLSRLERVYTLHLTYTLRAHKEVGMLLKRCIEVQEKAGSGTASIITPISLQSNTTYTFSTGLFVCFSIVAFFLCLNLLIPLLFFAPFPSFPSL